MPGVVHPSDERSHRPGPEPSWEESWTLAFVADGGALAGSIRLALRPHDRVAWWWSHVLRRGRPLVAVRDHEVEVPREGQLEVRASGLWGSLVCESGLDHWSYGMEAFGVELDDPRDAVGAERGQPVAVGFDLEWEASELASGHLGGVGYDQGGVVHGEVLVGSERIELDGFGARTHDWGDPRWWTGPPRGRASVRLDDGRWFHGPLHEGEADRGLLRAGRLPTAGLTLEPMTHAPVRVPRSGADSVLARAVCRARADDGGAGWGWAEWLVPAPGEP